MKFIFFIKCSTIAYFGFYLNRMWNVLQKKFLDFKKSIKE
jgi:hypothetical protein